VALEPWEGAPTGNCKATLADLKRLSGTQPLIVRVIWLMVLPELRRNSAIRKVLDWIISVTRRDGAALLGAPT
jgi:hypothetical protein